MNTTRHAQEIEQENARSLNTLIRAITLAQNQFALILVRCNYRQLRDRVIQQLHERCPIPLKELTLPESAKTLYTMIQRELGRDPDTSVRRRESKGQQERDPAGSTHSVPRALMICGLEAVHEIEQVLVATNIVREELRKKFPFPLVLWVNDRVLHKLDRLAPDLKSWGGNAVIQFELAIEDLIDSLKDHTNDLFAEILEAGDEWGRRNRTRAQRSNALHQVELEFALNDIHTSGQPLEPEFQADLDFLLGRDAHAQGELKLAEECYQRSLDFWQDAQGELHDNRSRSWPSDRSQPSSQPNAEIDRSFLLLPSALERAACILVHLGLCWRSYAVLQRSAYEPACRQALAYFQRSLVAFEQANRLDLMAKFIIPQAETLQKLARWDELEIITKNALILHKLYSDPVRQARDHGFLAEIARAKADWAKAKRQAEMALKILEDLENGVAEDDLLVPHLEISLEVAHRYHQGWYLLLLASAEAPLGQTDRAIAHLELARNQSYPQDDPQLYIQILRALRTLYFEQGRYLEAFHTKQIRRLIEHQYHFRAFVGALRLQPQQRLSETSLSLSPEIDPNTFLAQEIAASGRQQDLDRLVARMGRNDYKLTVIHGPSGVGKSSILKAGFVPALQDHPIGDRTALPIILETYTDWESTLADALAAVAPLPSEADFVSERPEVAYAPLLDLLRYATEHTRLPILIFDQFEEFFFVNETLQQRRLFYRFLYECLNLDFVKVVLSLREDYLHYLLEFQRLITLEHPHPGTQLDSLDDILSKDVRYPLRDFSPEDARSVIHSLTTQAQFYLDRDLVDELVRDLAGELGEVRPIELQVVGAQLQAEAITTLAEYRQRGPKEQLVARSLEDVVADCGPENEPSARLVLFLLTNENGTRPSKTRDELVADLTALGRITEISKLDLVLQVLVGAGLVFLVPETPADRYQLVHDYLIDFIRNQLRNVTPDDQVQAPPSSPPSSTADAVQAIETTATLTAGGRLTIQVPSDVAFGRYRIVLMMEQLPSTAADDEENVAN